MTSVIYREHDQGEQTIEVVTYVTPGCSGSRDKFGAQMEPDEPASVEIEQALIIDGPDEGDTVDLTDLEIEEVEADSLATYEDERYCRYCD